MLKKVVMIILLIALAVVAYWYFAGINKAEKASNKASEDVVELNESESQAIDILNDEIMQDKCKGFAKEDSVKDDKLKVYIDSCVEQLRAEATMVEPGLEGRSAEEIQTQCSAYAKEDKVIKEKLEEYMDLCAEQLRAEDTMVEPEDEQESTSNAEAQNTVETEAKKDAK